MFTPLFKKGLPFFWEEKGSVFSQKEYHDRLSSYKSEYKKIDDMQQCLSRNAITDKSSENFEMLFAFRATCAQLPEFSYVEHVELRVLDKEMANLELPTVDQWKTVE